MMQPYEKNFDLVTNVAVVTANLAVPLPEIGLAIKGGQVANGTRVFWSGGKAARAAAEAYALKNGAKTLEMTLPGKILDVITTDKTYPYLKPLWNLASQNFARGAKGSVTVFQSASRGVRIESVWAEYEYFILKEQGNMINYLLAP